MRGVKQGGVLSGAFFNFFINNLIEECYQSGVGAIFIDDICLPTPDEEGM